MVGSTTLVVLLLWIQTPARSVLHCYDMFTQIGTTARRQFTDERGFVLKEIYYTTAPPEDGRPERIYTTAEMSSCDPDRLRVQSTRTYVRDALGRAPVVNHYHADGRLKHVVRSEFDGRENKPSRVTYLAPDGTRRSEMRYQVDGDSWSELTRLDFDGEGRVVSVDGRVPSDVTFAFAWRPMVGSWRWGIALQRPDEYHRLPSLFVNVRNVSSPDSRVPAGASFEPELRDSIGRFVEPSADGVQLFQDSHGENERAGHGEGRYLRASLDRLYGRLGAGRYTLKVWHRDPDTLETVGSNVVTFTVGPPR